MVGLTLRVFRSRLYIKARGRGEAWSSVRRITVRDTGISGRILLALCFLRDGSAIAAGLNAARNLPRAGANGKIIYCLEVGSHVVQDRQ